jgi:hypothetical protein
VIDAYDVLKPSDIPLERFFEGKLHSRSVLTICRGSCWVSQGSALAIVTTSRRRERTYETPFRDLKVMYCDYTVGSAGKGAGKERIKICSHLFILYDRNHMALTLNKKVRM